MAFLEPDRAGRLAEALRIALPGMAVDRVLADKAWPALAKRLSQHEAAAGDVHVVVRRATEQGFQGARSIAKILHHRIGLPRPRAMDGRGLPAWITTSPDATHDLVWSSPLLSSVRIPEADQPVSARPVEPSVGPGERASETATRTRHDQLPVPVDPKARALAVEITEHAWTWWTGQRTTQTWARHYMADRGLTEAEWGTAPAPWTGLSDHLQTLGYTPDELVDAGVATRTRNGRLIDRFRNRIIFPVRDQADVVVGVTARINPADADERTPKYLNTPETVTYRKSELLLGLDPEATTRLAAGAHPVLVEGATDHAALHLAASALTERTSIEIVQVAACGTGITQQHLQALRDATGRDLRDLIVALDADNAGRTAAARVWDTLAPDEAAHARALDLPTGTDPAQAATGGPDVLATHLVETIPLAWFAMESNLQHIRSLDHFERQIPVLRVLVDHLHGRVEPTDWPTLIDHVAQTVADTTGAGAHVRLDVGDARRTMVEHYADRLLDRAQGGVGPEHDLTTGEVDIATTDLTLASKAPEVQAWLVRHADLIAARLDGLVERAVTDPELWMETLTPPPLDRAARETWTAALQQVLAYRDRYQITSSTDPLGPTADGERGDARLIAIRALQAMTLVEHAKTALAARRVPRPMERVPVVLNEARTHGERMLCEADERARHDRSDRERDRAANHGWWDNVLARSSLRSRDGGALPSGGAPPRRKFPPDYPTVLDIGVCEGIRGGRTIIRVPEPGQSASTDWPGSTCSRYAHVPLRSSAGGKVLPPSWYVTTPNWST